MFKVRTSNNIEKVELYDIFGFVFIVKSF